jgi:hypothetical protein
METFTINQGSIIKENGEMERRKVSEKYWARMVNLYKKVFIEMIFLIMLKAITLIGNKWKSFPY